MKIQCEVCNKDEASVFCTADEAALCGGCDLRVHHANKLASKHERFSLHLPSSKQHPVCDVCQERRAFVFCQQDRAILCKVCDLPIHSANEHTQKHDRFLLSGIRLSAATPTLHSSISSPPPSHSNSNSNSKSQSSSSVKKKNSVVASSKVPHPPLMPKSTCPSSTLQAEGISSLQNTNNEGANSNLTSSISEYLIETLPGWQVEDLLDSCSVPFGFCKSDHDTLPLLDADMERNLGSLPSESLGIWVPQAPSSLYSTQMDPQIGYRETKEATNIKAASRSRSRFGDDNFEFIVPQISPSNIASKRSRFLW